MANTLMGGMMYAVHLFARAMPMSEYGVFTTLLQVINLMGIPAVGLQSVFAHQTAMATSESDRRQLRAAAMAVTRWTFGLWCAMAALALIGQSHIVEMLQMSNPAALWITVLIGLAVLWFPIGCGLLQGRQDFVGFGWAAIANGFGRFASVAMLVVLFHGHAASALIGALVGFAIALAITAARNRDLLTGPRMAFDFQGWLRRVLPLTLGLGVGMFMLAADMIVVRSLFDKERTGLYAAAGMIGRALVFFTIPVTAVMFPKVVRSSVTATKSVVLAQTLALTGGMGVLAASVCTVVPWLPIRLVQGPEFLEAAPLVPWFAWCMLPLTLANVLINNLMARSQFASVPYFIVIAAGYAAALMTFNDSFETVIKTLGSFGLLLLGVASWFTWGPPNRG